MKKIETHIKQAQRGNSKSQQALFDATCGLMKSVAYRYSNNAGISEDIVQEGYVQIFKYLPKFKYINDAAAIGWMKRIVATEAIRYMKKTEKWNRTDHCITNQDAIFQDHLEYNDLFVILMRLPLNQRVVFNMHAMEGYSHQEIADHLNIAVSSSRSLLSRARTHLQSILQKQKTYGKV